MTAESTLIRGRTAALRLMLDQFDLARPTGAAPAYDPNEQAEVEPTDPIGSSVGKIQSRALVVTESEAGGRTLGTVRMELHLPVDAPTLRRGDIATMTTPGPLTPPALVGRKLRIVGPVGKSWATAMRYEVEEVVS